MTKTKITQKIEENALAYLEVGSRMKCREYLKNLGFDDKEIDLMLEQWQEGKSLYPYE